MKQAFYKLAYSKWETKQEKYERRIWLFEEESFVPAAMIKKGKAYSIMTDHLGRPTEAYDSDGNEVWSRTLDMNGEIIEETGRSGMIPFLFQGQYHDWETGLAYNRFRYYSPQMGIYISQDPIGLEGGILNLYGYVEDTNAWVDILGLSGRGGYLHRSIQEQLEKHLGELRGTTNVKTEGRIKLPNNQSRFGDVIFTDPATGKITEVHQIGDTRSRGGFRPAARERGAIMDIREASEGDVKIVFHDKKGRVTLINPDQADDWKIPSNKHRKLKGGCNNE